MRRGKHILVKNSLEISRLAFSLMLTTALVSLSYLGYILINYQEAAEVAELPATGEEDKYRVFITSTSYEGNFGGISFADNECNRLGKNGKWVALLFDCGSRAPCIDSFSRVKNAKYYLFDYSKLVIDWTGGVTHSSLQNPINLDENLGSSGDWNAWTGYVFGAAYYNCNQWTTVENYTGTIGESYSTTGWFNGGLSTCNGSHHFYCFEVSRDQDQDGYAEDIDCNDNDSSINPGASETCDAKDNNCDGQVDEGLSRECGIDTGECQKGVQTCSSGSWGLCAGEVTPTNEVCDNKDNDCDGVVDDGLITFYGTDTGECRRGIEQCIGGSWVTKQEEIKSVSEICDGNDNDCDGRIDELSRACGTNEGICTKGTENCVGGSWGNCTGVLPQQEVCDGLDNDCDGQTDENCPCNIGTTQSCGSNIGICKQGTQWCENGYWGTCIGAVGPRGEVCDGKDNDCDGQTDENLSRSCGSNVGICEQGVQYCSNGVWGKCSGAVTPQEETCDGEDNDCDGAVDEGCACASGEERSCGLDIGECAKGTQKCFEESWSECEGSIEPSEEICDGKDNDCDGEVDEGYVCEEEEAGEESIEIEGKEDEKETKGGLSDILDDFLDKFANNALLIVSIIVSVLIIASGIVLYKKRSRFKEKKLAEKFKKGEKIAAKKKSGQSPLA